MFNLSNVCQMKVKYPKVKQDSKQRVYVEFYHRGNRYRLFNGKRINSTLSPNSYPINERKEIGNLLAAEVYQFLNSGLNIELFRKSKFITNSMSDLDYLGAALDLKKTQNTQKNI